jgi:3-hydroxyisobutyrate dehydrogenase
MSRIAFIGLGNLGGGMAANQVKAGHAVSAFDLAPQALERATRDGCTVAPSAADAVKGAEVVVTMLPAGQHVRQVFAESVLPNAAEGALLIDCSTIDVDSARAVAGQARDRGFDFADAPVSGGIAAAEGGALTFMVGCPAARFEDVKAALQPMAKAVVHAGEAGAGQAAKICNNMALGITMLGICEGFALAERLGLKADKFFEVASQSSAQCWSLNSYCPWPGVGPAAPSDRGYEGGFLAKLMLKDLKLAQAAAASAGAATPMGAQAEGLFALFERLGYGDKDFSGVLQMLRGHLDELDVSSARGGG